MKYLIYTRFTESNIRPYHGGSPVDQQVAALVNNLKFELGARAVQIDGDKLTVTIESGWSCGHEASVMGAGVDAMNTVSQILKLCQCVDFTTTD